MAIRHNFDENDIEVFDDFIQYYGFDDDCIDDPKELNFESKNIYDDIDFFENKENDI